MKNELLNHIVCPTCGQPLSCTASQVDKKTGDVVEGRLLCKNRKPHEFKITKSVPRLLDPSTFEESKRETQDSFSKKWHKTHAYGFDPVTKEFHTKWFVERYGLGDVDGLKKYLSGKKLILDAGAGTGRLSKTLSELTDNLVFGIDISESIDDAQENLKGVDNVFLIQADLNRLPFPKGFFDLVVCDMVLHHTPDPHQSFKYLSGLVKKTGEFATYVYKVKGPIREFCDDFLRQRTTEMSFEECYKFSEAITKLGKSLAEMNVEITVPEDIPLLEVKKGKYDLQRFFYWHILKCFWNKEHGYDYSVITNLDWYHPKDAYRYRPQEIQEWIKEVGFDTAWFYVGDSGISIRIRPGKKG